jgi:hypothetical protein
MAALGRLRSDVRIGEFCNWASCYPSNATAAFGQEPTFDKCTEMAMKLLPSKHWFRNKGASSDELQALMDSIEVELPKEYLELLAFSNGGEGLFPCRNTHSASMMLRASATLRESNSSRIAILVGS